MTFKTTCRPTICPTICAATSGPLPKQESKSTLAAVWSVQGDFVKRPNLRCSSTKRMNAMNAMNAMAPSNARPSSAPHRRRALWQRAAATIANTAAAAAALLLVVNPSAPLGSQSNAHAVRHDGASASASALINDALCFPATDASASVTDDNCEEPLTVAMVTDPDDYLSPFDGQLGRGSAIINACLVEDLACEPG